MKTIQDYLPKRHDSNMRTVQHEQRKQALTLTVILRDLFKTLAPALPAPEYRRGRGWYCGKRRLGKNALAVFQYVLQILQHTLPPEAFLNALQGKPPEPLTDGATLTAMYTEEIALLRNRIAELNALIALYEAQAAPPKEDEAPVVDASPVQASTVDTSTAPPPQDDAIPAPPTPCTVCLRTGRGTAWGKQVHEVVYTRGNGDGIKGDWLQLTSTGRGSPRTYETQQVLPEGTLLLFSTTGRSRQKRTPFFVLAKVERGASFTATPARGDQRIAGQGVRALASNAETVPNPQALLDRYPELVPAFRARTLFPIFAALRIHGWENQSLASRTV
jgi:hypothetical protein